MTTTRTELHTIRMEPVELDFDIAFQSGHISGSVHDAPEILAKWGYISVYCAHYSPDLMIALMKLRDEPYDLEMAVKVFIYEDSRRGPDVQTEKPPTLIPRR